MKTLDFKETFIPYHQKLYRIAYRLVQDSYAAEDLLQETYIKLWTQQDKWSSIKNTEAYAIIVLRNTCMDYLRERKKQEELKSRLKANQIVVPEHQDWSDEVTSIKKIVNTLPEQQRIAFWLKHWEDCPNEEIERVLEISSVNLRVTLSRARKTIREQFLKWRST